MKLLLSAVGMFCLTTFQSGYGQSANIGKDVFFNDTTILNVTLTANFSRIYNYHGKKDIDFPGSLTTTLPDSTKVDDRIILNIRGHFRLDFCYVPPIKIIFNYKKSSRLYSLKSLKLVNQCKISKEFDQYLLKEYMIYKIYNLLSDMSFRVRLLNLTLQDSSGRKKTMTEHAFLIEDIRNLAKRNNCRVLKNPNYQTEATDRRQMTTVAIFEYMIGNTDWAVSVNHNVRLISSLKDSSVKPFVVPYDFDYSGFVNTAYAVPDDKLEIENVRQRLYRGFPRTLSEIEEATDVFRLQKDTIYSLVNNFSLLTAASKIDMTFYLDEFYKIINDPKMLKYTFVDNSRNQ
jgi:hypothetical protein